MMPPLFQRSACAALLAAGLAACTERPEIVDRPEFESNPPRDSAGTPLRDLDPGRVGLRRLSAAEYNNTVRDLTGTQLAPADTFLQERALGFDTIASSLGMTPAQYQRYFEAAAAVASDVMNNDALRGKIAACSDADAQGRGCALEFIERFATRAYRRPIANHERTGLAAVYDRARSLGEDHHAGIEQVLRATLASLPFLYRVERNPAPSSASPHLLDGYALASRLSYFVWSTLPDDELLELAANGELQRLSVIREQLDRLLADARAAAFVDNFAGRWLGFSELQAHAVDPVLFPSWNDSLRSELAQEAHLYFGEFLWGGRDMNQFLTAESSWAGPNSAPLYGIDYQGSGELTNVALAWQDRVGFLGLGAFLAGSSFSHRTSPTLRAKWILSQLLCSPPSDPPPGIPPLEPDPAQNAASANPNLRQHLAAHSSDPGCASCHRVLDPVGLGLEHFDAIGRRRSHYDDGTMIDPAGQLPSGATFVSLQELAALLTRDERYLDCVTTQLFTYAVGRAPRAADRAYLDQLLDAWRSSAAFPELLRAMVSSDTFRLSRGEAAGEHVPQ